ncbi:MAG: carboxy-S-adenosyl-L-methionine synthase CmoA [Marinicella sp.]
MSDKDNIFSEPFSAIKSFAFDEKVVAVFPDMIKRSVPGYDTILKGIAMFAMKHVKSKTHVYDLGASLGGVSLTLDQALGPKNVTIHAIDISEAMIAGLKQLLNTQQVNNTVLVEQQDLSATAINDASMVISNFTLQFIDPSMRDAAVKNIYQGMNQGGVFVLSEKVESSEALINAYHGYKKINGYSDGEIARKRQALEDTLLPDTVAQWKERLAKAGFTQIEVWFRAFNFVSFVCVK